MNNNHPVAVEAGWFISKIGDLLLTFGINAIGLVVILALSSWLNLGLIGVGLLLLFVGLITATCGYRLYTGKWIPPSWLEGA